MKARIELYRQHDDGRVEMAEGELTDEHPTGSYGLPVVVLRYPHWRVLRRTLHPGVYGSGELPAGTRIGSVGGTKELDSLAQRARWAGYQVDDYDWTEAVAP